MVKAMKNLKKSKMMINIISVVIACVFIITPLAVSGIQDDKFIQGNKTEQAQLGSTQEAKVVTVSKDDPLISGSAQPQQDQGLSPIENAASLAVGYVQAGMSREEIITVLTTDLGYTETEAKIAYSKASAQTASEQPNSAKAPVAQDTSQEEAPGTPAADRVKEGIGNKPRFKFRSFLLNRNEDGGITFKKRVTADETNTVKEMLGEGYSIEDIAQGFADNNYSTKDIIAVFQKAEVSASDTYSALSKTEISKAEEKAANQKPSAKFKNSKSKFLHKIYENRQSKYEQGIVNSKKDAVTGLLGDMKEAGFDISGSLDGAVADLKAAGLSASEAYDAVKPIAVPNRPSAKFRNNKLWQKFSDRIYKIANKTKPSSAAYGEAEYALAASMLKAGYAKSEIAAEFKGTYKAKDVLMIMSAGETRFNNSQNTQTNSNSNNTINNTNTQQDILRRKTQAIPI